MPCESLEDAELNKLIQRGSRKVTVEYGVYIN